VETSVQAGFTINRQQPIQQAFHGPALGFDCHSVRTQEAGSFMPKGASDDGFNSRLAANQFDAEASIRTRDRAALRIVNGRPGP
jgi:hypothetical protein